MDIDQGFLKFRQNSLNSFNSIKFEGIFAALFQNRVLRKVRTNDKRNSKFDLEYPRMKYYLLSLKLSNTFIKWQIGKKKFKL